MREQQDKGGRSSVLADKEHQPAVPEQGQESWQEQQAGPGTQQAARAVQQGWGQARESSQRVGVSKQPTKLRVSSSQAEAQKSPSQLHTGLPTASELRFHNCPSSPQPVRAGSKD